MEKLQVHTLGRFSIETQGRRIDEADNRSQKPWLLIAYLIYNRGRTVTQEDLLRVCWFGEKEKDDPANALRVVLHRARAMLDKLEVVNGLDMIVRTPDGFQWSDRLTVVLDGESFERLWEEGKAALNDEKRLICFQKAVDLYHGKFLNRFSGEPWVQYKAEHFHALYLEMALAVLDLLSGRGRKEETVALCRRVLTIEPYHETVSRRLMEALLDLGQAHEVKCFYEQMRAKLLAECDRLPEEETGKVYFKALRALRAPEIPVQLNRLDVDDTRKDRGAKVCDFAFFRMFYASAEWLVVNSGLETYNVLLTVGTEENKLISARMQERVMENLIEQLRVELNRGDTITRCADNQIMMLIVVEDYEAACLSMERQIEKFYRNHPNSAVALDYSVWRVGGEK